MTRGGRRAKPKLARDFAEAGYAARRNVPVVAFGIRCCAVTMCLVIAMAIASMG